MTGCLIEACLEICADTSGDEALSSPDPSTFSVLSGLLTLFTLDNSSSLMGSATCWDYW